MGRVPSNAAQIRQRFLQVLFRAGPSACCKSSRLPFASCCHRRSCAAIFEKCRRTDSIHAGRHADFSVPPEDRDEPVKQGFLRSSHWRCGTPRLQSRLAEALKNRQRVPIGTAHRDVRSRVIASESCASFAARQWNRFVWQPVVFVVRSRCEGGNRRAGRPRNNLRRKRNQSKTPLSNNGLGVLSGFSAPG